MVLTAALCSIHGSWGSRPVPPRRCRCRGRSGARLCPCRAGRWEDGAGQGGFVTPGAGCQSPRLCCHHPREATDVPERLGTVTADAMSRPRAGTVPTGTGLPFWIWLWVTGGILGLRCGLGGEQGPGGNNRSLCSCALQVVCIYTCILYLFVFPLF